MRSPLLKMLQQATSEDSSSSKNRVETDECTHKTSVDSRQPAADCPEQHGGLVEPIATMKRSPGEILFFKLLHFEFQKAVHFFDRAIAEFSIREERVVESVDIVNKENRCQLWTTLTKSVYRLYSDLLLLESFCIMTYCSFSKILKKHDKVTGFDTRNAFMSNVVNKANFTTYTRLQEMITRCENLYSEVSNRVIQEGQQNLYEDERLFIEMVHQLNQQKA
jgi:SPX domain protein involved in polyphosphate accumulation